MCSITWWHNLNHVRHTVWQLLCFVFGKTNFREISFGTFEDALSQRNASSHRTNITYVNNFVEQIKYEARKTTFDMSQKKLQSIFVNGIELNGCVFFFHPPRPWSKFSLTFKLNCFDTFTVGFAGSESQKIVRSIAYCPVKVRIFTISGIVNLISEFS